MGLILNRTRIFPIAWVRARQKNIINSATVLTWNLILSVHMRASETKTHKKWISQLLRIARNFSVRLNAIRSKTKNLNFATDLNRMNIFRSHMCERDGKQQKLDSRCDFDRINFSRSHAYERDGNIGKIIEFHKNWINFKFAARARVRRNTKKRKKMNFTIIWTELIVPFARARARRQTKTVIEIFYDSNYNDSSRTLTHFHLRVLQKIGTLYSPIYLINFSKCRIHEPCHSYGPFPDFPSFPLNKLLYYNAPECISQRCTGFAYYNAHNNSTNYFWWDAIYNGARLRQLNTTVRTANFTIFQNGALQQPQKI